MPPRVLAQRPIWAGDGGFFEEEVGSEDGALGVGEGADGGDCNGADGDRDGDGVLTGGGGRRKSALTPGPSPVRAALPHPEREGGDRQGRHRLGSRSFFPLSSSLCCLPGLCWERRERLG